MHFLCKIEKQIKWNVTISHPSDKIVAKIVVQPFG